MIDFRHDVENLSSAVTEKIRTNSGLLCSKRLTLSKFTHTFNAFNVVFHMNYASVLYNNCYLDM